MKCFFFFFVHIWWSLSEKKIWPSWQTANTCALIIKTKKYYWLTLFWIVTSSFKSGTNYDRNNQTIKIRSDLKYFLFHFNYQSFFVGLWYVQLPILRFILSCEARAYNPNIHKVNPPICKITGHFFQLVISDKLTCFWSKYSMVLGIVKLRIFLS